MPIIQTYWPADHKKLGDRFGVVTPLRKKLGLGAHRGIDFALPAGTPLVAVGNGTVVLNAWSNGLGHQLEIRCYAIDPKDGKAKPFVFAYDHLREAPALKVGDKVKGGEVICYSGNSGAFTSGEHLHFMAGTKVGLATNTTIDPIPLIKSAIKPVEVEL